MGSGGSHQLVGRKDGDGIRGQERQAGGWVGGEKENLRSQKVLIL